MNKPILFLALGVTIGSLVCGALFQSFEAFAFTFMVGFAITIIGFCTPGKNDSYRREK